MTLDRYVDEALREHLAAATSAEVELPVFEGGHVRAGIDASSDRELYDALDDIERS
ncbi:hypothetical protein [Humibacter ginsengisoli]